MLKDSDFYDLKLHCDICGKQIGYYYIELCDALNIVCMDCYKGEK